MRIDLSKYIYTKTGRLVISALFGIGLAAIFREVCEKTECMIKIGPTKKDLDEKYRWNGKCYSIESEAVSCNSNNKKTIIPFST